MGSNDLVRACCCPGNPCGIPSAVTVSWSGGWVCEMVGCDCTCSAGAYMVEGTISAPTSVAYEAALDLDLCTYAGAGSDELAFEVEGTACPNAPEDCLLEEDPFPIAGTTTVDVEGPEVEAGYWRVWVRIHSAPDASFVSQCRLEETDPDCQFASPLVDRQVRFTGPSASGSPVGTYAPDESTWWDAANGYGSCGEGDAEWFDWTTNDVGTVVVGTP